MTLMAWQDWVGNFCYLILAGSYLVTNMYWLRLLAIVALGLEGVYFYFSGDTPLWVGIEWAVVFVSINLVQLIVMTRNRIRVRLTDEQQALYRDRFAKLDPVNFDRLVRAGAWQDLPAGIVLAREGAAVDSVYLLVDGSARVDCAGRPIAMLWPGSFAGEMSFLSGEAAAATVTTASPCRVFAVRQDRLRALLGKHEEIRVVLQELFGYDLVRKLRLASHAAA
jgi:Cyclic nucleotide-binding domain